jgi:ABC-type phosphate/phosphonate transport system permease subunit
LLVSGYNQGENVQNPVMYHLAHRFMDRCRTVNEMAVALMFAAAVGLGPFSEMMALAIHVCGYSWGPIYEKTF